MYQTVSCFASLFVLIVADKRVCAVGVGEPLSRLPPPRSGASEVGAPNVKSTRIRSNNNNGSAGRRRIEHLGMLVNCGEDSQVAASYTSASSCKSSPQLAVVRSIFLNSSSTDPPKRFLNRTQSTFIEHTVTLVNCYHN